MTLQLSEKHKQIIISILSKILDEKTEVYVFGSRSRGTVKKYADIDLALQGQDIISQVIIDKLNIEFNNSLLPYKVDIVDLKNIDEDFYNSIKNDLSKLIRSGK